MYSVGVRSHIMIAHSLRGELFGPAQRLHGATYTVEVELRAPGLGREGVVVDIGRASAALRQVLDGLDFKNLDEEPDLGGANTTTEFLARLVFDRMAPRAARGELGGAVAAMKVTLHESPVAWAAYEGAIE